MFRHIEVLQNGTTPEKVTTSSIWTNTCGITDAEALAVNEIVKPMRKFFKSHLFLHQLTDSMSHGDVLVQSCDSAGYFAQIVFCYQNAVHNKLTLDL